MAHSIQRYGDKTALINDLDLLVIIGFAIEIISQSQHFLGFQSLATQWRESLLRYGPGVIDLNLEQLITTPDGRRQFRRLLSSVLEKASQHDKMIPAQLLNKLGSAPGVTFGDYSVSHVEEAVKKLQALTDDK